MEIIRRHPRLDALLVERQDLLGRDFTAYYHHCCRYWKRRPAFRFIYSKKMMGFPKPGILRYFIVGMQDAVILYEL